ncbi:MAG: ribosome maturation factor RimP [Persicimonas sp.]
MARRRKKKRQFFDDAEGSSEERDSSSAVRFTSETLERIEQWSEEAARAHGLSLWDVEKVTRKRWIIRVYVERPGDMDAKQSVNVDVLAEVSRYLEAYLDAADDVRSDYVLEVSTPGVERKLRKPEHVQAAVGHRIQLVVRQQVAGKNKIVGELQAFGDDTLTVDLEEDDGAPVDIDWADVKEAQLKYDFEF